MSTPNWYAQLVWQGPFSVATVARGNVPEAPGLYVFTDNPGPLAPGKVLYVGKAKCLKQRLGGYLVDYMATAPTKHKGRAFIFEHRHDHGDQNTYLRWAVYGDPIAVEGSLIQFLEPACNDRFEPAFLEDYDELDARFMP